METIFEQSLQGQGFTVILLVGLLGVMGIFSRYLILQLMGMIANTTKVVQDNTNVMANIKELVQETSKSYHATMTEHQKEIIKLLGEIKLMIKK